MVCRRADAKRDDNGEPLEPFQLIHIPTEKIVYACRNKRPIEERTIDIFVNTNEVKFRRTFEYDKEGRITKIYYLPPSGAEASESFTYDAKGNLILRVIQESPDEKRYFKYTYR